MFIKKFFQIKCVSRRDVLKYALTHDRGPGLCWTITRALEAYSIIPSARSLDKYIPAFTFNNALQFGARKSEYGDFWWPVSKWDTGREAFLRWLIDQYKNDTTNLLEIENDQN